MKFNLEIPVEIESEVYLIHHNEVDKFFVKKVSILPIENVNKDISGYVMLGLERYNDGVNFYEIKAKLSKCFKSKLDLLNSL